jgi:D-alanine--poly(phosphoribitol) ligase subunit 2
MLSQVLEILAEITNSPELAQHPDLKLYDLHLLDSFKTIELMLALSERFGVEISPAEFERQEWETPRAIAAFMETKVAAAASF